MRQKLFPCCKKPMGIDELFEIISDSGDGFGSSSKSVTCPHCGKPLNIYLNIDSVEVED